MRKSFVLLAACGLVLASIAANAWETGPQPVKCTGVLSGTINANIVAGQGCFLTGATINGNVQVLNGGNLAFNNDRPSTINGNLIADKCTGVFVNVFSSAPQVKYDHQQWLMHERPANRDDIVGDGLCTRLRCL